MAQNDTLGADKATDERALYEKYAAENGLPIPSDYSDGNAEGAGWFACFKAGRATLAAVPASEPEGWVLRRAMPHCDPDDDLNERILKIAGECGIAYDGMGSFDANADELIAFGKAMAQPAPVSGMPDLASVIALARLAIPNLYATQNGQHASALESFIVDCKELDPPADAIPSPQAPDTPNPTGETK